MGNIEMDTSVRRKSYIIYNMYISYRYGVYTGGTEREGDKPTNNYNKSDRTYKPPPAAAPDAS